jgi:lysophospholipase L1-like esterase
MSLTALFVLSISTIAWADDAVIDSMDELHFHAPASKATTELVSGKFGKAVRFSFADGCSGVFCVGNIHGRPEWDRADGFSFWVKGDGSHHFGGLEFIYDDDYSVRYDFMFPIDQKDWRHITVARDDLIPVMPGPRAKPLDATHGNRPSKLTALMFGKWWYWRDYAAHSYAIDDMRLEPHIVRNPVLEPTGPPLERVYKKLKAGKPITIVTMGDSLTDFQHWSNRQVSWPVLLKKELERRYHTTVTIVNPAIGGTQLRQNLVLMPRWLEQAPAPDLVTVCFGGNDWESGMRGAEFEWSCRDAIDRIRRATKGKADILLITTLPTVARWTTMAELAEACRKAAKERHAGLADTNQAFMNAGKKNKEHLFGFDHTHLGPAGHELVAQTVLKAIENVGKPAR